MADEKPVSTEQDSVQRLAEIRERARRASELVRGGNPDAVHSMAAEDVPYLLELIGSLTAERDTWLGLAERAEPIIRDLKDANMRLLARAEAAEAEVKRLREALAEALSELETIDGNLLDGRETYVSSTRVEMIRAALATPPSEEGQS